MCRRQSSRKMLSPRPITLLLPIVAHGSGCCDSSMQTVLSVNDLMEGGLGLFPHRSHVVVVVRADPNERASEGVSS